MFKAINGETVLLVIGVLLTWLIFVLGVAKLAKFYLSMSQARREVDTNLTGIANQLNKMQTIMAELLKEQRRTSRLIADLTDLKKAEMTGEYEIVETPIDSASTPAQPLEEA
jgi:hypothetical protein